MLLLAVPLGVIIGLSLGALGGGGSILTVPALVYLLDQDPRGAITSSLLIVGVTSLIGLIPHARAGRVRMGQGLLFGLLGTAGSFAGSRLSVRVSPSVLLAAFAVLMLFVAALMIRQSIRSAPVSQKEGEGSGVEVQRSMVRLRPFACDCRQVAKVLATATAVGLLTGFFGVGGGFALVPALVLVLGFPMPVAVGTSLLVIAVNSATALAARVQVAAELDWVLISIFTAAAVVGSLLGSRVAGRVSPRRLSQVFAGLLVLVALYTGVHSALALL
ncbi:MAG: sulfite exporter TauE/SafE family protein [Micrococcales bacterium]|nr:sulfite exporter TauE/SafE family protein [Micrococcales bacterium]